MTAQEMEVPPEQTARSPYAQQMIDVLDDTIAYYSLDPGLRAKNAVGQCVWLTDDGKKCAVARLLSDGFIQKHGARESDGFFGTAYAARRLGGTDLPDPFLNVLQAPHDDDNHWSPSGLTPAGRAHADSIRSSIESGAYEVRA